jgi:hypothetical protein
VSRIAFPLVLLLLAGCSPRDAADRILVNGNVLTVDAEDTIAQALAIKDGRILAVGTNEEIEALAGPETDRIDLNGRTATPGLLDAHCHFAWGGADLLGLIDLSYPKVQKVQDAAEAVRARIGELAPGEWVQGQGWDEGKLAERRYLYASDLDSVSPENPVWLTHTMGHYGVANSLALENAGITKDTPDPPGGTIDRNPDGTPTGVLKESAQALVVDLISPPGPDDWQKGIEHMARELNQEGMTGLKEPGIGDAEWEAYQRVLAEGKLTVRVFALRLIGETWTTPTTVEDARARAAKLGATRSGDHLIAGGVKMYMDGSGGARTAWLYDDWNKSHTEVDTGNRGYPLFDPDVVREQIQVLHDSGVHVSVHAIGDRAIDWVVDSYALALEKTPTKGLRHGIIHANIPTDHALDEMARLQREYDAAYPEPSATFLWWIGDTYAGNFGPERALRLNPFRTYLDREIRWADGSDFGVTPFPARYGLWASVKRQPLLGTYGDEPWGSEQGVDVQTALRSRTIWAARQMFLENEIGSLEAGKYADVAVWEKNVYEIPADDIQNLECEMTLFAGEVVYQK